MRRSYPDAPFLSGCVVPIRIRGSYPDAPFLSGCAVPIRMRRSYPDTRFLSRCAVPIQMRRSYPDASFLSRCEATSPPGSRRLACGQSTGLTSSHGSHPSDAITRIGNQHPVARPLSTRAVPIHILKHSYPQGNIPCRTCPQDFA